MSSYFPCLKNKNKKKWILITEKGENENFKYFQIDARKLCKTAEIQKIINKINSEKTLILEFTNLKSVIESGEAKIFSSNFAKFIEALSRANVNFLLAKPLPFCLLGDNWNTFSQKFNIPLSCRDCLYLFYLDKNNNIHLCNKREGPNIKYMSSREQIFEYFEILNEVYKFSFFKKTKACESCRFFLRKMCQGVCDEKKNKIFNKA